MNFTLICFKNVYYLNVVEILEIQFNVMVNMGEKFQKQTKIFLVKT